MITGTEEETADWGEEMVTMPARYLTEMRQTVAGMLSALERIEGSTDPAAMHRHAHRAGQGGRTLLAALERLS